MTSIGSLIREIDVKISDTFQTGQHFLCSKTNARVIIIVN